MTPKTLSAVRSLWPEQYQVFRYVSCHVDGYRVRFGYELVGEEDGLSFTETVEFAPPPSTPDPRRVEVFRRVVELLYLVAGVSYYKMAAPKHVQVLSVPMPASVERYVRGVYAHGLGEFAFRNNLPQALRPEFAVAIPQAPPLPKLPISSERPLVAMGGGKDSIVSAELLRREGMEPVLFSVNPNHVMRKVVEVSGLQSIYAQRRFDEQLFELTERGAYNGHVPVTAVTSLAAVATSVLHGLGPVVMSNERSASAPNLTWRGQEINHQWSKSLDAERQLADVLTAHVGPDVRCFSLLRPFSELHIARMFAETTGYDAAFTSCNAVFKLLDPAAAWCGDCPKCRFVFLALAPFASRARLTGIFGKNLLDDAQQLSGYRELVGLLGPKPFECVGEIEESLVALGLLAHRDWRMAAVVRQLLREVPPERMPTPERVAVTFTPSRDHAVPASYDKVLGRLDGKLLGCG
ncbi:MAG: hypothetical protein ACRDQZ_21475 [Mycobacteriales bacterium]